MHLLAYCPILRPVSTHPMPCHHKFEHYLGLETIDFEPETLIVGTFNPALPAGNPSEWFYGRPGNYFWDVLPRLYGSPSLMGGAPAEWKQFCRQHRIALTDLISCIEDADTTNLKHNKILAGFSDDAIAYNFDDFVYVDVAGLLRRHPSIRNVYLTRGITEAFWRHLWNPVMHYCDVHKLHERKLLTPSGSDFYQQAPGTLPQDHVLLKWQQEWHG